MKVKSFVTALCSSKSRQGPKRVKATHIGPYKQFSRLCKMPFLCLPPSLHQDMRDPEGETLKFTLANASWRTVCLEQGTETCFITYLETHELECPQRDLVTKHQTRTHQNFTVGEN